MDKKLLHKATMALLACFEEYPEETTVGPGQTLYERAEGYILGAIDNLERELEEAGETETEGEIDDDD